MWALDLRPGRWMPAYAMECQLLVWHRAQDDGYRSYRCRYMKTSSECPLLPTSCSSCLQFCLYCIHHQLASACYLLFTLVDIPMRPNSSSEVRNGAFLFHLMYSSEPPHPNSPSDKPHLSFQSTHPGPAQERETQCVWGLIIQPIETDDRQYFRGHYFRGLRQVFNCAALVVFVLRTRRRDLLIFNSPCAFSHHQPTAILISSQIRECQLKSPR